MTNPTDPWVLVTGATRGIGRAVTERLVAGGRRVVGVYRSDTGAAVQMASERVRMVAADLGAPDGLARVLAALDEPLVGAVFNAGVSRPGPLVADVVAGTDPLDEQLAINLAAPLRLCR